MQSFSRGSYLEVLEVRLMCIDYINRFLVLSKQITVFCKISECFGTSLHVEKIFLFLKKQRCFELLCLLFSVHFRNLVLVR